VSRNIRFLTHDDLDWAGDPLTDYLGQVDSRGERWLRESPAKRLIAWELYGDLLTGERLRVLDVGSGYSSIQEILSERHEYLAVDLGIYGPGDFFYRGDWRDLHVRAFDVVIANDLFPNVDQGLGPFLERFPGARLSLTVYEDRYYRVRRVDADEVLTIKAWDWKQTRSVLERFMDVPDIQPPTESLFDNGRQVCLVV
jgi:hypothetical protein